MKPRPTRSSLPSPWLPLLLLAVAPNPWRSPLTPRYSWLSSAIKSNNNNRDELITICTDEMNFSQCNWFSSEIRRHSWPIDTTQSHACCNTALEIRNNIFCPSFYYSINWFYTLHWISTSLYLANLERCTLSGISGTIFTMGALGENNPWTFARCCLTLGLNTWPTRPGVSLETSHDKKK